MNATATEAGRLEAQLFGEPTPSSPSKSTDAIIQAMLQAGDGISDLIFSPGRSPQVEQHGHLTSVDRADLPVLGAEHTARVAR